MTKTEALGQRLVMGATTRATLPAAFLFCLVAIVSTMVENSLRMAAILAVLTAAASLAIVYLGTPRRQWSVAFLYLIILAVFHVGAFVFPTLGLDAPLPNVRDGEWFYSPENIRAACLVSLGLAAYALGTTLGGRVPSRRRAQPAQLDARWDYMARVGCGLLALSVAGWFFVVVRAGGVGILTASYSDFLTSTVGTPLPYIYELIAFGLGLSATTFDKRVFKYAMVVFMPYAVFAFVLGLRGEVLFPVAAAVMIRSQLVKMPSLRMLLVIVLVCLSAVSVVKEIRQTGVSGSALETVVVSPAAGLAELGCTVRVVTTSVSWHEYGTEPYAKGATYMAPFERGIDRYILHRPIKDAREDDRLMNVEIARRVGNIGGSVIGEAHHNYGILGVILVLGGVGVATGRLSENSGRRRDLVWTVVIMIPLLNHVRNSFVQVPSQMMMYTVIAYAAWILSRGVGHRAS